MTAPHRPFLRRFTLALLGMLLFVAVVFAGLGWMVGRHEVSVMKVIGKEKTLRLSELYLAFMANLMPSDQDGDMVCDGAELFYGNDPRNPKDCPPYCGRCLSHPTIITYCGERLSTHWMQEIWSAGVRWPQGFRVVVSADEPVLLAKAGAGPPTKGPLVLGANERGELEFDLSAEKPITGPMALRFGNAVNNKTIFMFLVWCPGWKTPPIPVALDGGPPSNNLLKPQLFRTAESAMERAHLVSWSGDYVIEAAPEFGAGIWKPMMVGAIRTEWAMHFDYSDYFPGYTGPLKFRIVPVSATPP